MSKLNTLAKMIRNAQRELFTIDVDVLSFKM